MEMLGFVGDTELGRLPNSVERERLWARWAVPIAVLISAVAIITSDGHNGLGIPLQIPSLLTFAINGWRRLPSVALAIGGAAGPVILAYFHMAEGSLLYLPIIAVMVATHEQSRTLANVLIGLLSIQPLLTQLTVQADNGWPYWMMGTLFGWGFGTIGRTNAELLEKLDLSRQQIAEQAVALERRRIARDIHDLVGHSLTVVLLHVTGARRAMHRNPEVAEEALELAERVGRESLVEIRRSVNLLREEGSDTRPSPEGADIDDLIAQSQSAGQSVELSVDGDLSVMRGAVGLTVYRVLQESLNNAAKHAPGARVDVEIRTTEAECLLLIDNGAGGPAMCLGEGGGFGLLGMRERVQAVGGTLVVGPEGSRWRVEASIPLIEHLNQSISEPAGSTAARPAT